MNEHCCSKIEAFTFILASQINTILGLAHGKKSTTKHLIQS